IRGKSARQVVGLTIVSAHRGINLFELLLQAAPETSTDASTSSTAVVALIGLATAVVQWLRERKGRKGAEEEAPRERDHATKNQAEATREREKVQALEKNVSALREQANTAAQQLQALLEPPPIGPNERRISVLLIGLGGSGKTTLIDGAFGNQNGVGP